MFNLEMLNDCELKARNPWPSHNGCLEIRMRLPRVIDLRGIKPVQHHPSDHCHYENKFGSFFIDCTGHASFYPACPDYQMAENFCSLNRWTSESDRFKIWKCHEIPEQLHEDSSPEEIIEFIRSFSQLSGFLHYFFKWIHEFGKQHGYDKHFYPPRIYIPLD